LAAPRPFDLLELAPGLSHESAQATTALALRTGLALRLLDRANLTAAVAGALGRLRGRLEITAPLAAPCARGPGHYLVSRCSVWLPHQRQYFFVSNRSGVFRLDLFV
jgi:hypothetical protein